VKAVVFGEYGGLIENGRLQVTIAESFTFAQAAEAHRASERGHVRGKLVLVPA
jgi:NADPH:quinone reductase-like Zn-dependent oxidoreductase